MDHGSRPATQHGSSSLKALAYEDTVDGVPPRKLFATGTTISSTTTTTTSPPSKHRFKPTKPFAASSLSFASTKRPRTSPAPRPAALSQLSSPSAKRDSGIAPSLNTPGSASYAESDRSANAAGAARSPTLPTIVVQDEEGAPTAQRTSFSFIKRRSADTSRPPPTNDLSSPSSLAQPPPADHSFQALDTDIPSDGLGEINLGDLASDKIGFSHRGSLLFGGKKMNELIAGQAESVSPVDGVTTPPAVQADEPQDSGHSSNPEPTSPTRLVAGRRNPSSRMLQAARESGRVLSAEEITFSTRVRSMYEHGDENAVDWTNGNGHAQHLDAGLTAGEMDGSVSSRASDAASGSVSVQNVSSPRSHSASTNIRSSYYAKDASETAGGIEDWDDVDGRDVDRYGFIRPRRAASRLSVSPGEQDGPSEPMQRVATSLRPEAARPRQSRVLRRMPSLTRSTRSAPPRSSNDWTIRTGGPGSVHSVQPSSRHSSANPFRSKDRKVLAEASEMLTLPPGLADIAEEEDAGRTASRLKQREWAREEKWQKMAIPVSIPAGAKGGGMRFRFDTTDPKVVERTWKGIPDRWRATAWHSFLAASAQQRRHHSPASDDELMEQYHELQEVNCADDVQIDVDVPRTVSMHVMFRRRYRGGQRLLFRVLHAVALYFPDTGYVQGMASLAATFLCYFDEEHAFAMMVRLWQLRGLEQLFQDGFQGLMTALHDLETLWLARGDVAPKLDELGITSTAYGTRWYLTLFNMSIPFPAQLRVWDVFLLLGDRPVTTTAAALGDFGGADLDVLHATSAALIDATRDIVLDSDFENAMKVLTSFVPIKDEDLLMRVAHAEWRMAKKRSAGGGGGGGGGKAS